MNVAIRDLTLRRGAREVLAVPRLDLASGRITVLLGPNGSGKSTLLRVVSGLERPQRGTVAFDGRELSGRERSRHVAYSFQRAVFVAGAVRDNLDLALRLRGVPALERSARIDEAVEACGIGHIVDRNATRISGGEAQRVNLARALALRAPLTLLDEPLAGLDGAGRRQLLHALPGLLREFTTTALVVTHDREEASRLADDLVVLVEGTVRASGTKEQTLRRPPDSAVAEILGFTLIPEADDLVAVAPSALHPGTEGIPFDLIVEAVAVLGSRTEISGSICSVPVTITTHDIVPTAGERLRLVADPRDVIHFPTGSSAADTTVGDEKPLSR